MGKSLGTLAMGYLLTAESVAAERRAVWLTPLLGDDRLREQMLTYGGLSLFAIGTDDPGYDPTRLAEARAATGGEAVVIEGADHSLDVAGDVIASLRGVERVVRALGHFIAS